ncbi:hypothetical protein PMZ80_003188 [Knufia obscura]|uniref:BZIP domain-containing protein n=1 Tax=Knufia obscura TaxID=1635080 RepID=A0ABR0RTI5_9EURO|nr:hypothetical protein PMZ80_003188 [Knufia obscura]
MAAKRRADEYESDLNNESHGSGIAPSVEGAGPVVDLVPSTTNAPAVKRQKMIAPVTPAGVPAKKRSRPSGKGSGLRKSTPASKASTPAAHTSAQDIPGGRPPSRFVDEYNHFAPSTQQTYGPSSSTDAHDGTPAYPEEYRGTPRIGTSPADDQSIAGASLPWEEKHENAEPLPIYNREFLSKDSELVKNLSEQINAAEERAKKAERSIEFAQKMQSKHTKENAILKKNRTDIIEWLQENAPGIQLPDELINVNLAAPSSLASEPTTTFTDAAPTTSPIIDLTNDDDEPSPITSPTISAAEPETLEEKEYEDLTREELHQERERKAAKARRYRGTIASQDKQIIELKKELKTRRKSPKAADLQKQLDRLRESRDTFADAVQELARIERHLTAMLLRYGAFVENVEVTKNIPNLSAEAKAWIARPLANEALEVLQHVVYADYTTPASRATGSRKVPDNVDPTLEDGRKNSQGTIDSGYGGDEQNVAPPAATSNDGLLAEPGMAQTILPPMAPHAPANDGNHSSSPETHYPNNQHGTGVQPQQPDIYEDEQQGATSYSYPNNFNAQPANFVPQSGPLNVVYNTGNHHGDGNVFAGVDNAFNPQASSTDMSGANQSHYQMTQTTYEPVAHFPTSNLPHPGPPPPTANQSQIMSQTEFAALFNQQDDASRDTPNYGLPVMAGADDTMVANNVNLENNPPSYTYAPQNQQLAPPQFLPNEFDFDLQLSNPDFDDFHFDPTGTTQGGGNGYHYPPPPQYQ